MAVSPNVFRNRVNELLQVVSEPVGIADRAGLAQRRRVVRAARIAVVEECFRLHLRPKGQNPRLRSKFGRVSPPSVRAGTALAGLGVVPTRLRERKHPELSRLKLRRAAGDFAELAYQVFESGDLVSIIHTRRPRQRLTRPHSIW